MTRWGHEITPWPSNAPARCFPRLGSALLSCASLASALKCHCATVRGPTPFERAHTALRGALALGTPPWGCPETRPPRACVGRVSQEVLLCLAHPCWSVLKCAPPCVCMRPAGGAAAACHCDSAARGRLCIVGRGAHTPAGAWQDLQCRACVLAALSLWPLFPQLFYGGAARKLHESCSGAVLRILMALGGGCWSFSAPWRSDHQQQGSKVGL